MAMEGSHGPESRQYMTKNTMRNLTVKKKSFDEYQTGYIRTHSRMWVKTVRREPLPATQLGHHTNREHLPAGAKDTLPSYQGKADHCR